MRYTKRRKDRISHFSYNKKIEYHSCFNFIGMTSIDKYQTEFINIVFYKVQ